MKKAFLHIFMNLVVLLHLHVDAQQCLDPNCFIGDRPNWIQEIPISIPVEKETDFNIRYILIDQQFDIDQETHFTHYVKQLISPTGVQHESMIEIPFDPTYESITLHQVTVIRQDCLIDKLATSRMEVIQQEKEIDNYLYNGKKTWLIFLDDIQPGDIIEYSFSRKGQNAILGNYFTTIFQLQANTPLVQGHFRIISALQKKLAWKNFHTTIEPHYRQKDGKQEWLWEIFDMPAYYAESSRPSWCVSVPMIQVTEFDNWQAVADWGAPLYSLPESCSPQLQELAKAFMQKSNDVKVQALHALRFVQEEIRYLGFELGSNAFKPHDPNLVLQRRSGDCKDKTLLLKTILSLMSIESSPVLVNTYLKGHICEWLPSNHLFNHVILQIYLGKESFCVDPTSTHQGGDLATTTCKEIGKGLVLDSSRSNLLDINTSPQASKCINSTRFIIKTTETDAKIVVKSVFKGLEANKIRSAYKEQGVKELEKSWKKFYSSRFGNLQIEIPFQLQDDTENNEIVVECSFAAPDLWSIDQEEKLKTFEYSASDIARVVEFRLDPMRNTPFSLDYPCHIIEDIYFQNDQEKWSSSDWKKEFQTDEVAFFYERKVEDTGHCLHARYEILHKKDHVPVESIESYRHFAKQIEKLIYRQIEIPTELDEPMKVEERSSWLSTLIITVITLILWWLFYLLLQSPKKTEEVPI